MLKTLKQKIYSLLRQSEKYTKTDMVYLAKGGSWLIIGQMITSICSFLLALAFANLLPKETYGNYKYIFSLIGILGIFALPGIGTAITQAVARGLEGSFYTGFKTKLKWSLLGSLVALGLAGYYFFRGNYILPIPLLIPAIFLPLMQASGVYGSFLTGRKLFSSQAKYSTLSQIISIGALIATLFLTKDLFWLIAVYFVSHTFLNYFFYLTTRGKFNPNKKEGPETLSYGKHLSLMGVIGTVASYLDRILVFHYLGVVDLAIYSFAIVLPEQLKGFLKNLSSLVLPKFSIRSKEEIKATIFQKMLKFTLFISLGIVAYIFLSPYFYKMFFPQYTDSVFYSQIFSISLITAVSILPTNALKAKIAKRQLYQLNIYSPFIQIALLFFFLYFYGLLGIIIARVLSRFINLGIILWLVKRI